MDSATHRRHTRTTATYPQAGQKTALAVSYAALGLVGETGELANAIRHNLNTVAAEAGDVLWYVERLTEELGLDVEYTDQHNDAEYSVEETVTRLYDQAATIAELVKKHIRQTLTAGQEQHLKHVIQSLVHSIGSEMGLRGITLTEVRTLNVAKLADRQQRGVLHGEGDNR